MKSKILKDEILYDGSQLRWDFGYLHEMPGDSIIAFRGPCSVQEHMVDLEDIQAEDWIQSPDMLHIIVTKFHEDLITAVYRQYLYISKLANFFNTSLALPSGTKIRTIGDDLMVAKRKLSVSIATTSGHATVIHIGINVRAPEEGAVKVPTIGLAELGVDEPLAMIEPCIEQLAKMENVILAATHKVCPVT